MNHKGLLIYAPNQLMDIEIPKPDGSLGLLYLASSLEKNGIPTDILDANTFNNTLFRFVELDNGYTKIGMSFEEIAEYVNKGNYTFIGMTSNFTPQTKMIVETAKVIKKSNPEIKIYLGGVNARALKYRFLNTGYFDGICLTDGELILPRVILEGIENVPGWIYLDSGNIKENPVNIECFPKDLDDLPMPAWEKVISDKYDIRDVLNVGIQKTAAILTSRGCPFRCTYCHISGEKYIGKYRTHSIERVTQEVKKLKKLGIKKIYIEDESLSGSKKRTQQIFNLLKDENISFMNAHGSNILHLFKKVNGKYVPDIEYLNVLYNAGVCRSLFAVESGSQRILDKYCTGKIKLNEMDIISLFKTATDIGIKSTVNIVIGFPDETEEEIYQSIEMGRKLKDIGALYVSFFYALPFPGSKLFDMAIKGGYLDEDFNPDIMNYKNAIMKNTTVPPQRLIEIRDKANIEINGTEFVHDMESKTIGRLK